MKKYIFRFTCWLFVLIILSSCQKAIDVNLNSVNPKIVIEASISDQPGPYTIKLTKTVNFNQSNNFPAVSGALVSISDDAGNSEILIETSSGIYVTNRFQGFSGRTYRIEVTVDGEMYTSVSKMPAPTDIDSLTVQKGFFGSGKLVYVHFRDSAGITNQYRFIQVVNDTAQPAILAMDDSFQDGENIQFAFFSQEEDSLRAGDSVMVLLQSIDKGAYEYLRTLSLLTGSGGPPSDAPANPVSNLSNGALGYFSAYAIRSKIIVIP